MRPIEAAVLRGWFFPAVEGLLLGLAIISAISGARTAGRSRLVGMVRSTGNDGGADPGAAAWRRSLVLPRRSWLAWAALISAGAALGWLVAGPMGGIIGLAAGIGGNSARRHKRQSSLSELLEGQLADLAESVSLGLRSGLSVVQALEYSRIEAVLPIRAYLDRFVDQQRLGVPFDRALERLGDEVDTDDARFFVLVTGIHAKSGGDLAGALDEVGRTIRHRIAVRRELRAASAQGRMSGVIMGSRPIAFFLFLSVTSRSKLAPILRSGAGMGMVGGGLVLEALAYVWIRRLLRVEV
jgi:tight adherence protein B